MGEEPAAPPAHPRGLVERQNAGRTSHAVITEGGWKALRAAQPAHAEQVRRLVFDHLSPAQVGQLAEIARIVLAGIDRGIAD